MSIYLLNHYKPRKNPIFEIIEKGQRQLSKTFFYLISLA